ncbi:MAG TPA: hypothetical protein VGB70_04195 [Allosphingosinicella sp.]|jgi:uncharacterized membrane protein
MRRLSPLGLAALALTGCGRSDDAPAAGNGTDNASAEQAPLATKAAEPAPATNTAAPAAGWHLQASGEGTALAFPGPSGMRLFCPAGGKQLLVNVPGFRPIGSEERLSFGSGGAVVALVADTNGDSQRGGVSGAGAVPAELAALLAGPVSASYGAQTSGPHPAPPAELARAFTAACRETGASKPAEEASGGNSPCTMQGDEKLAVRPLRVIGTEPFWASAILGRCVTYSHPEDQKGTRIWTRYTAGANGGGTWAGNLGGKPFELRLRAAPGCSDGMSDRTYPLFADLLVGGERRRGCAAPQ